jgi:hemerythrin-like domain-containing protein
MAQTHGIGLPGHRAPAVGLEAPFEMLVACHERVQRSLDLMARLQQYLVDKGVDDGARNAARDVMRYFDLAAPLHHQDEELHVFPPLLAGADEGMKTLVRKLMADHRQMEQAWEQARIVLHGIVDASASTDLVLAPIQTDHLNHFASLYWQHIHDEEQIVYPAAQAVAMPAVLHAMSQDMMRRRGVSVERG